MSVEFAYPMETSEKLQAMQHGLEAGIMADPQLSALLDRGYVNYNPDAMGKEVFVPEGAKLEMTA